MDSTDTLIPNLDPDIPQILQETGNFTNTLKRHRDTIGIEKLYNDSALKLFKFRILPFAYVRYLEKTGHSEDQTFHWSFRARPCLSLIMEDKGDVLKLVGELEKRSDIAVYVSSTDGEVVAGSYQDSEDITQVRRAQSSEDLKDANWNCCCSLTALHKDAKRFSMQEHENLFVVNIWATWGLNINLLEVVEQVVGGCKYEERDLDC